MEVKTMKVGHTVYKPGTPMFPNESPTPIVSQSTILLIGVLAFGMARVWPPLILIATYFLSLLIPYSFRVNDTGVARRRLWKDFERLPDLPKEFKDPPEDIIVKEGYWENKRGMLLATSTIYPKDKSKTRAVLCLCHGYTDTASFMKRIEYQRFVREGIAVATLEYEGHGRSDGTIGHIPSWDALIDDTVEFFKEVTDRRFPGKKRFLMGESMGGAVAYSTYKREPKLWSGIIFSSPMCKISDEMLPPQWVINLLFKILGPSGTESLLGILPIAPSKGDLQALTFRVPEKRSAVIRVPTVFGRNPRLNTARELLNTTAYISEDLKSFDAPFLVQHGENDRVTCPKLSQALYDEAASKDKEIKIYRGMWHALTCGESDEDTDIIFRDAINWVLARI